MKIFSNISLLSLRVWQRNVDVYRITWATNLIPPFMEPILYLVAFGAGVGALVKEISYRGDVVSYTAFIAPGMIATQAMFQAFYETTFSTFVRMTFQNTFEGMIATPLSLEDIMLGELLWGTTKSFIGCTLMLIAISFFGIMRFPEALIVLPLSFLAGMFFSGLGMIFTSWVPRIDLFNFPTFLFVMPMFLFSGTFFPLEVLPQWAQWTAKILPLTHVVDAMREATLGKWSSGIWSDLTYLVITTLPVDFAAIYFMKRRMVK